MTNATPKMASLPLSQARRLAHCWRVAGGRPAVEVAALEPTLWREGNNDVADLTSELARCGMTVSLTTNDTWHTRRQIDLNLRLLKQESQE